MMVNDHARGLDENTILAPDVIVSFSPNAGPIGRGFPGVRALARVGTDCLGLLFIEWPCRLGVSSSISE